jgi:hypothetical protein
MDTEFTETEIRDLENSAYQAGVALGEMVERERIITLIQLGAEEWLSHDGVCDCRTKGEEGLRLIALIKGDEV